MIHLYGSATTNTRKIAIGLAELGLEWLPKPVSLEQKQQHEDWFLSVSPNNKVPVIVDTANDMTVWESGAILMYLSETYDPVGSILAKSGAARYRAIQASFFQAAHIGPNLGRLNDQLLASDSDRIPQMLGLFYQEAERLTRVLDRMFADGRPYIAGDFSIADIMHYPWLKAGLDFGFPALLEKTAVVNWLERVGERPAVQTGMNVFA